MSNALGVDAGERGRWMAVGPEGFVSRHHRKSAARAQANFWGGVVRRFRRRLVEWDAEYGLLRFRGWQ